MMCMTRSLRYRAGTRAGPGGPGGAEGGMCKETLLALRFSVVPAPAPLPSVCRAISVCLKHPGGLLLPHPAQGIEQGLCEDCKHSLGLFVSDTASGGLGNPGVFP